MPARKEQEITGPSSEPKKPLMQLGSVAAPVARTLGQGITANWVLDAFETWDVYDFTDDQYGWSLVGLTALMSWVTNALEKRAGQRLIGAAE